jgi:hypothetical protein
MATTTNYSFPTPDDTDLVKDGASAIRSLGTAVDTQMFTNAGAAIAKSLVDAKGDIIAATADDTVDRLAVGANDTVLTADSSEATGLKWAAPAGGMTKIATGTFTTAATVDIDNVFTTSYSTYFAFISTFGSDPSSDLLLQYRYAGPTTETGANYYYSFGRSDASQTASQHGANAQTSCLINLNSGSSTRESKMALWFNGVGQAAADEPVYQGTSWDGYNTQAIGYIGGFTITDRIYTGLRLLASTGTISGNYAIYGLAI